jgi:hypothetical protein
MRATWATGKWSRTMIYQIWKTRMTMRLLFGMRMDRAVLGELFVAFIRCLVLWTDYALSGNRTYTLYIMYSPYYRTPRMYMSGYLPNGQPLPPHQMMEDIVGDYKDKTVTLEDFPFFANSVKMASVHPCKHAPVMKTLLDRADAALKVRREKLRNGAAAGSSQGMEGLVEEIDKMDVRGVHAAADPVERGKDNDEWEEVQAGPEEEDVAIRVDQYLVVFLKVSSTPREVLDVRWCANSALCSLSQASRRA